MKIIKVLKAKSLATGVLQLTFKWGISPIIQAELLNYESAKAMVFQTQTALK